MCDANADSTLAEIQRENAKIKVDDAVARPDHITRKVPIGDRFFLPNLRKPSTAWKNWWHSGLRFGAGLRRSERPRGVAARSLAGGAGREGRAERGTAGGEKHVVDFCRLDFLDITAVYSLITRKVKLWSLLCSPDGLST